MQILNISCVLSFLLSFVGISQVTVDFTSPGSQTWVCPANVNQITVQCWGGGGGGGNSNNNFVNGGSGGGGGAFAKKNNINVIPGNTYYLNIGSGGAGAPGSSVSVAQAGGDSWFNQTNSVPINNNFCKARGGTSGINNSLVIPNNGGTMINSYGDTIRNGGSGFAGNIAGGGGGGSSAGLYINGNAAISSTGAIAPFGGGNGGNGSSTGNGNPGGIPGGGGGGSDDVSTRFGGAGAVGKVRIIYFFGCNNLFVPSISSNSNAGCGALTLIGTSAPQNTLGLTYQWQISNNINGPWSNIPGAVNPILSYNCSADSYFRLTVTCSYANSTVSSNIIFYDFQSNPALAAPTSQNLNVTCGQNTTITALGGSGNGYLWSPQIQDTSYQGTSQWPLNFVNNDTTVYVQTYLNPPVLNSITNINSNNQLLGFYLYINNCGTGNYQGSGSVGFSWQDNLPQGVVVTSCQITINTGNECNAGIKTTTFNGLASTSFTTSGTCWCGGSFPYTIILNPNNLIIGGINTFLITNANNFNLPNGANGNYAQILTTYNIGQPCVSQVVPINITIQQPVTAGTISAGQTICSGSTPQNLTFNGLNGSIQWQYASHPGGPWITIAAAISDTLTGAQIGSLSSTRYFRVLLSNLGCTSVYSDIVTITINPLPLVNAGLDQTICIGSQAAVSASGANSYVWVCTWGSPCAIGILNNVPFTVNSAMNLTVTGTDLNGCSNSDQLTISSLISATGGTSSTSITSYCVGSTPQSNVTLSGHGGQIQWQYATNINGPWTNYPGATTTTLSANSIGVLNTTTYIRAQLSWGNCPNAFSTITSLFVFSSTIAGTISSNQILCAGTTPDTLILNGYVGNNFIWQYSLNGISNWLSITNWNNAFLLPNQMGALTSSRYFRVVTTGPCGQQVTAPILVTINPVPIVGIVSASQTICIGSTQSNLTLNTSSGSIEWQSLSGGAWTTIPGATSNILTVAQMGGGLVNTTSFRVIVSSGVCNPVISNIVTISVGQLAAAGSISPSDTVCTNTQPNNVMLTNFIGSTISWQISTNGSIWNSLGTNSNILLGSQIGPITSQRYIRAFVQNSPCVSPVTSAICTLFVASLPLVGTISANQTICQNTSPAPLIHSGNYVGTWQWQFSNDTTTWFNIQNQMSTTLSSASIGNLTANTYFRIMFTNQPCNPIYSNTVLISVIPSGNPGLIVGNQVICNGNFPSNLVSSSNNGSLQWQFASNFSGSWTNIVGANASVLNSNQMGTLTATRYYRLVSSNAFCPSVASNIITISVSPQSNAGNIIGPNYVCLGESVNALQLVGNIGSIQWLVSTNVNGPYTPISNANSNSLIYGPINQSTYFQVYSTSLGCSTLTSSTFVVHPYNLPIITASQNQTICYGQAAILLATGGTSYVWSNQTNGLLVGSSAVVQLLPQQNTIYEVVGEDNNGCSNSAYVSITVNPLPTAILSNSGPNDACETIGVPLSVDDLTISYQWNLNNIPIQGATSNSFLAQISGNYSVTITNQNTGCSSQTNIIGVSILPNPTLWIVGDSSICQGENTSFNLTSDGQTYWEGSQTMSVFLSPIASTTYQVSAISNQGCQSSISVTVMVHSNNDTTIWVSSFGSFSLNGFVYNETGVFQQQLQTIYGCDSTITINLNFIENVLYELGAGLGIFPNLVEVGGNIHLNQSISETPIFLLSIDGRTIQIERNNSNEYKAPCLPGVYYFLIGAQKIKIIVI